MKKLVRIMAAVLVITTFAGCSTLKSLGKGNSTEAHQNAPGQQKK